MDARIVAIMSATGEFAAIVGDISRLDGDFMAGGRTQRSCYRLRAKLRVLTMTRDASGLITKEVLDTSGGTALGRVKDAIFDPDGHVLYGLIVDTQNGDMSLGRESMLGFGEDAVTVENEESIRPLATETRARELMETGIHLRGTKVITEGGDSLGALGKIMLNDGFTISSYEASKGILGFGDKHEIRPAQVVKIGTGAIVVENAAAKTDADEQAATDVKAAAEKRKPSHAPAGARSTETPASTDPSKETLAAPGSSTR
jgi:uncharacterized protein YrrD